MCSRIVSALIIFFVSASVALAQTGARYLIITHDDYYSALEPLACWKTQKGVRAKIVTLSEAGSDSIAIKAYITSAYNTWQIRPEYLLLVGNKYQLPFPRFVTAGVYSYSDNYYANVVGDFRNELYHGRLWVSDTVEAKTAVAKILSYEKNPPVMFDSLWYRKGVTIVNEWEEGQPSSALLYWADARFAHQQMLDANFAHIDSFSYELGNDNIDVLNAINEGRTYMLYRGIGGGDWIWPFEGVSPAQMDNGYRMPVVLSATCATVEGIGQDWTVAGTPTQPKGVIAFFGTTTNLFEAAEMRSALCRGTTASLFSDTASIGVAAEAGRLEYYAQFNDLVEYHSWMCLGDPEMFMWKSTPKTILVEHNAHFTTGICTASVYVQNNSMPTRGALVCVMAKLDTSFYHYGYTDDIGSFQFIDTLHIPGDSVFITVTGRDLKPYYDTRPVFYVGGPYVRLYSYTTLDSLGGNGDDIINPGEDIELPFCLRNWGDATAYGIVTTLEKATSSVPCTLHDTTKYVGDIMPYESVSVHPDGYNVLIDEDCPDLQEIALSIRIEDATTATWTSDLGFTVHAPVLSYHDYYFDQHVKYTNPGDTSEFYVAFLNTGSYKAENPVATISSSDSLIEIIDSAASFQTIHADSIAWNSSDPFIITAADNAPNGYSTIVTVHVTSGVYTTTCSLAVHMGQKDYFVWDPDINQSSGPVIDSLLNSLHFSGEYSTAFPYGFLSLYKSVYVCAGVWPLDYLIIDTSQSGYEIERYLEIENGNVYLEGGDVWYHPLVNHGYDFGPLFGIHLVYNTIGLLNAINGRANTFTQNMTFRYQGEATMLDCIDTTGGSQLIFEKANSLLACGVAANNRTVGVSFELSGLVDTIVPSTKADLLAAIMNYFGVSPTSVTEQGSVWRQELALLVHPNPSRYGCNIDLQALGTEKITLKVYDVSGRCVTTLIDGMAPGDEQQTFFWNRLDEKNRKVPAGVYFVRLETNNTMKTIKTILLN